MRQPVALVCADAGKTVLVANRRSGGLSVIDAKARKVVAEYDVGRGLSDLALLKGGRRLLAVDGTSNELLLIDYCDRVLKVIDRLTVSPGGPDGSFGRRSVVCRCVTLVAKAHVCLDNERKGR